MIQPPGVIPIAHTPLLHTARSAPYAFFTFILELAFESVGCFSPNAFTVGHITITLVTVIDAFGTSPKAATFCFVFLRLKIARFAFRDGL